MRPSISLFIFCLLFLILPSNLYSSTKKKCLIVEVKHSSTQELDTIQLRLNCPFSSPLSYHFDYGFTEITIPDTAVEKELFYKINNRFLKDLNIQNSGDNSILRISFADRNEQKIGLFDHESQENDLLINISRKLPAVPKLKDPEKFQESQPIATGYLEDTQISIIKMLAALFFILLIIYSLLWMYKRFTKNRYNFKNQKYDIRLVSSYHIGAKQKVAIIEINQVAYACGITPNSINIISQVNDQHFWSYFKSIDLNKNSDQIIDFAKIKQEYSDLKNEQQKESKPQKPKFANEFLKKVKNLKPID